MMVAAFGNDVTRRARSSGCRRDRAAPRFELLRGQAGVRHAKPEPEQPHQQDPQGPAAQLLAMAEHGHGSRASSSSIHIPPWRTLRYIKPPLGCGRRMPTQAPMKSSAAPADQARPTEEMSGDRDPYRPWIAEQIQHWTVSVDYLLEPLNSSADKLPLKFTEPVIHWNTDRTPGTAPRNPRRSSSLWNATETSLSGMPSASPCRR